MHESLPKLLKGQYLIVQNSQSITQITKRLQPVRLILARNPQRQPCQPGYEISTAFIKNERIPLHIDLYRHPDTPDTFEFHFQGTYYALKVEETKAEIVPI